MNRINSDNKPQMVGTSVYIPLALKKRLFAAAAAEGITVSAYVCKAVSARMVSSVTEARS